MIGSDGLLTLLLANLLLIATAGASLAWQVRIVRQAARRTATDVPPLDLLLVPGVRLRDDAVTPAYAQRLDRAALLWHGGRAGEILILGGRTGRASVSEAEQGRRYLIDHGIPGDRIRIEDRSAHTLENLRFARALSQRHGHRALALVTSRSHLARCRTMAEGLNLRPVLCAAEDRWRDSATGTLDLLREGYFLHWYKVGRAWSRWTGNRRSLAKIS
jgi:uncharacterized SAM-binding protein YcdF (DUF218 family)